MSGTTGTGRRTPPRSRSTFVRDATPPAAENVEVFHNVEVIEGARTFRRTTRVFRRSTGQIYKVEMRTHGTIAYRIPLYQKMAVGSSAGVIGSLIVFPIDMLKARLQNSGPGQSFGGVFRAILGEGGVRAFYRGLGANIVGVIPEKAIKLGVNDWLRDQFSPDRTQETLWDQTASGALTGVIQTVATNPMEVIKLRMQMQAKEVAQGAKPQTTTQVVRKLGLRGVYQFASTSMLRDVTYNCFFFPTYIQTKRALTDERGNVSKASIVFSGLFGGVVAATLATPVDVVKTRVQTKGASKIYKGVADCARKTFAEEGWRAFFKGGLMRAAVLGPLYAVALLAFEVQKKYLGAKHLQSPLDHAAESEDDEDG